MNLLNIGSIQKIEITNALNVTSKTDSALLNSLTWETLPVTPLSTQFEEKEKPTKNGTIYEQKLTFLIPKVCPENSAFILRHSLRKVSYRLTDANGFTGIMGCSEQPSYLLSHIKIPQKPEGYNGYGMQSLCKSTTTIGRVE